MRQSPHPLFPPPLVEGVTMPYNRYFREPGQHGLDVRWKYGHPCICGESFWTKRGLDRHMFDPLTRGYRIQKERP